MLLPRQFHKPSNAIVAMDIWFTPAEARRIVERIEIHYTPKHGSWLDMAGIELNIITRQCLARRIENIEKVRSELTAWEIAHNNMKAKISWQFTTDDARTKLTSLYTKFK